MSLDYIFTKNTPQYERLNKLHQQPWRSFYFLLPKKWRQQIKYKANLAQQQHVAHCWREFIDLYYHHQLTKFRLHAKKELASSRIIWQYWGQGIDEQLPEIVKLCFHSVDHHANGYQVIRLDDHNISEYIDLPDFVWQKRNNPLFKHAFFADLLRLALLDTYGGIWLDATILLTDKISDELSNLDFFMYQRDENTIDKLAWQKLNTDYFSWQHNHKINVLNSIIFAKKNNIVIHTCLDLLLNYWQTQNHIQHYFFFQILFNELIHHELKSYQCPIIDDTYPHLLMKVFEQPFDTEKFTAIKQKTNMHKLSYHLKKTPHSFYEYLAKQYL